MPRAMWAGIAAMSAILPFMEDMHLSLIHICFINVNSKIHVRMLTRKIDQEIDRAFLQMRVQNAWDYRKTTVDTSSSLSLIHI